MLRRILERVVRDGAGNSDAGARPTTPQRSNLSPEDIARIAKRSKDIQLEATLGIVGEDGVWSNESRYVRTVVNALHREAASLQLRLTRAVSEEQVEMFKVVLDLLLDPVLFGELGKTKVLESAKATASAAPAPGGCCGYIFKAGDFTFHCVDCSADSSCVMCSTCFENSNHEGHQVRFYTSSASGGYCDCGDDEAIDPAGFCSDHRAPTGNSSSDDPVDAETVADAKQEAHLEMPTTNLSKLFQPTVRAVCDFVHEVFLFKILVSADDRALKAYADWHTPEASAAAQFGPAQLEDSVLRNVFRLVIHNDDVHTVDEVVMALRHSEPFDKKPAAISSVIAAIKQDGFLSLDAYMPNSRTALETLQACRKKIQSHVRSHSIHRRSGLHLSVVSEAYQRDSFIALLALTWLADISEAAPVFSAAVAHHISSNRHVPEFYLSPTAYGALQTPVNHHSLSAGGAAGAGLGGPSEPLPPVPLTLLDAMIGFDVLLEADLAEASNQLLLRLVTKHYNLKLEAARAMARNYESVVRLWTDGRGEDERDTLSRLNVNLVTVPSILSKLCNPGAHSDPDIQSTHRAGTNFFCTILDSLNYMLGSCYSRGGRDGAFLNVDTPIFENSSFCRMFQDLSYAFDCANGPAIFVRTSLVAADRQFPSPELAPCFHFLSVEASDLNTTKLGKPYVDLTLAARLAAAAAVDFQGRKQAFLHRQLNADELRNLCVRVGMDTTTTPFHTNRTTLEILALHAHDFLHLPDQATHYDSPLHLLLQTMAMTDGIDYSMTRGITADSDINFDRFVRSFGLAEYLARATHRILTRLACACADERAAAKRPGFIVPVIDVEDDCSSRGLVAVDESEPVSIAEAKRCARLALDFWMAHCRPGNGGVTSFDSERHTFRAALLTQLLPDRTRRLSFLLSLQNELNKTLPSVDMRGRRSVHRFLHRFVVRLCTVSGLIDDLVAEAAAEEAEHDESVSTVAVARAFVSAAARADLTDDTDADTDTNDDEFGPDADQSPPPGKTSTTQTGHARSVQEEAEAVLSSLCVGDLKAFITAAGLEYEDCVEKSDLLARALLAVKHPVRAAHPTSPSSHNSASAAASRAAADDTDTGSLLPMPELQQQRARNRSRCDSSVSLAGPNNYYPKVEVGFQLAFEALKALSFCFEVQSGFWRNPTLATQAEWYHTWGQSYRDSDLETLAVGLRLMGPTRFLALFFFFTDSRQLPTSGFTGQGQDVTPTDIRNRRLAYSGHVLRGLLWVASADFLSEGSRTAANASGTYHQKDVGNMSIEASTPSQAQRHAAQVQGRVIHHLLARRQPCDFITVKKGVQRPFRHLSSDMDPLITDSDIEDALRIVAVAHQSDDSTGNVVRSAQAAKVSYSLRPAYRDHYNPVSVHLSDPAHEVARQTVLLQQQRERRAADADSSAAAADEPAQLFVEPNVAVQDVLKHSAFGSVTVQRLLCHPLTLRAVCAALGEALIPPPNNAAKQVGVSDLSDPVAEALSDATSASVLLVVVYLLNFACHRLNEGPAAATAAAAAAASDGRTTSKKIYGLDSDPRHLPSRAEIIDCLYRGDDDGITSTVGYLQGMLPILRSNIMEQASGGSGHSGANSSDDAFASKYMQQYMYVSVQRILRAVASHDYNSGRKAVLVRALEQDQTDAKARSESFAEKDLQARAKIEATRALSMQAMKAQQEAFLLEMSDEESSSQSSSAAGSSDSETDNTDSETDEQDEQSDSGNEESVDNTRSQTGGKRSGGNTSAQEITQKKSRRSSVCAADEESELQHELKCTICREPASDIHPLLRLACLMPATSTEESETTISKIAFSSCGHFLHANCLDNYLVEQFRTIGDAYTMHTCCKPSHGEFRCPLCKTFCNVCLPHHEVLVPNATSLLLSTSERAASRAAESSKKWAVNVGSRFESAAGYLVGGGDKTIVKRSAADWFADMTSDALARCCWSLRDTLLKASASGSAANESTDVGGGGDTSASRQETFGSVDISDRQLSNICFLLGHCQAARFESRAMDEKMFLLLLHMPSPSFLEIDMHFHFVQVWTTMTAIATGACTNDAGVAEYADHVAALYSLHRVAVALQVTFYVFLTSLGVEGIVPDQLRSKLRLEESASAVVPDKGLDDVTRLLRAIAAIMRIKEPVEAQLTSIAQAVVQAAAVCLAQFDLNTHVLMRATAYSSPGTTFVQAFETACGQAGPSLPSTTPATVFRSFARPLTTLDMQKACQNAVAVLSRVPKPSSAQEMAFVRAWTVGFANHLTSTPTWVKSGFPKTLAWATPPFLCNVPGRFLDFIKKVSSGVCCECGKKPRKLALCLLCGKQVCAGPGCSSASEHGIGGCTLHAAKHHLDCSMYLVLPDSEVVLLFREFSALIGRLYTDRYGSASGARMSSQLVLNKRLHDQLLTLLRDNHIATTMMQIRSTKGRVFVSNYW